MLVSTSAQGLLRHIIANYHQLSLSIIATQGRKDLPVLPRSRTLAAILSASENVSEEDKIISNSYSSI